MFGILKAIAPASDISLLTLSERRTAAGISGGDASKDADLLAMDLRVAAAICSDCNIATARGAPVTLRQEMVEETFRQVRGDDLILSRRHDVMIVSITSDGAVLSDADFLIDPEAGILRRLDGGGFAQWRAAILTVLYTAGFDIVPSDLKMAAVSLFRMAWLDQNRDPLVKSVEVDVNDIERVRRDYWVGPVPGLDTEGPVPAAIGGQLKRYRNFLV